MSEGSPGWARARRTHGCAPESGELGRNQSTFRERTTGSQTCSVVVDTIADAGTREQGLCAVVESKERAGRASRLASVARPSPTISCPPPRRRQNFWISLLHAPCIALLVDSVKTLRQLLLDIPYSLRTAWSRQVSTIVPRSSRCAHTAAAAILRRASTSSRIKLSSPSMRQSLP
jgi:hypothetical protein